jgi:hypothetical protein
MAKAAASYYTVREVTRATGLVVTYVGCYLNPETDAVAAIGRFAEPKPIPTLRHARTTKAMAMVNQRAGVRFEILRHSAEIID